MIVISMYMGKNYYTIDYEFLDNQNKLEYIYKKTRTKKIKSISQHKGGVSET